MQDTDFLIAVRHKRSEQMERYGIRHDHSIPRWALIISCEVGKLNHALEDLCRPVPENERGKHSEFKGTLKVKAAEQVYETAACMLAMLQESPVFNPAVHESFSA